MPGQSNRRKRGERLSTKAAQDMVLRLIGEGKTVAAACEAAGRAEETYRYWRRENLHGFKDRVYNVRMGEEPKDQMEVPDFPEFVAKYLRKPLPLHHLRTWDVLNYRQPRDWHESMTLEWGEGRSSNADDDTDDVRHLIINFPPDHAKSTVWTVYHTVWELVRNPNYRCAIVCQTEDLARKFLHQVKHIFQSADLYPELHRDFAPEGGWRPVDKGEGLPWRNNAIRLSNNRSEEKEPNVEAFGISGNIYGTRFDCIKCDDIEDYATASKFKQHSELIGQDIYSRIDKSHGVIMLIGTRVGHMDIYRYLRENTVNEDDDPLYTYFAQPAILENEHSGWKEWKVLWPERLGPKKIANAKAAMGKENRNRFAFVYQQRDVPEDSVIPAAAVQASVNGRRFHGVMNPDAPGHRDAGMQGLYTVCTWDPASSSGFNAMVAYAVDPDTKKRYVLDVFNRKGLTSRHTIPQFKEWTLKYRPQVWVIEKNALQQFISQLPEIREFANQHGAIVVEHTTSGNARSDGKAGTVVNKHDPAFGVEGLLEPLFLSCVEEVNGQLVDHKISSRKLIELPVLSKTPDLRALGEQLPQWDPTNDRQVHDLVMALWFAELQVTKYLRRKQRRPGGGDTKAKYVARKYRQKRAQTSTKGLLWTT